MREWNRLPIVTAEALLSIERRVQYAIAHPVYAEAVLKEIIKVAGCGLDAAKKTRFAK